MPQIEVVFYQEDDQSVPILQWLDSLPKKELKLILLHVKSYALKK